MPDCSRCQSADNSRLGSQRRCAFRSGSFDTDNWNCGTMNALRELAMWDMRDDDQNASIAVVPVPPGASGAQGYLVMTMYKNRGRTGRAVVMFDDDEPVVLTLEVAELVTDGLLINA